MATKLNENTEVALPLRNLVSMVAAASIATWAYFGIIERLNQIETSITMMKSDVEHNTEFRIKWPRGEMGSLPADSEQFMLIEHLSGELEKLTNEIESGKAPFDQQQKLTLDFYEKRIANLETQIEKLKDAQMEMTHKDLSK
jgi:archaellum component FlaC